MSQVRIDQVRIVYNAAPLAFIATFLNAAILSITLWPYIDHHIIVLWDIAALMVVSLRLILSIRFRQVNPSPQDVGPWVFGAKLGTILSSLLWGAGGYVLFVQDSLVHQVFLTIFIAGMSAGAVTMLSAQRGPAVFYSVFAVLPLLYRFSQTDTQFTWALGVVVPLFVIMLISATLHYSRIIQEMFVERIQRRQAQQRDRARNQVLEMLATGAPLARILQAIVLGIERVNSQMLGCILLLDDEGKRLVIGAAPSLPDSYTTAIDGMQIGPMATSCGAAAFNGERLVVEDIQTNPLWEEYRNLAAETGVRACWAEPVFAASGKVLGTFAIYHREDRSPSHQELSLMEQTANLVGIAIERSGNEEALQLAAMVYQNSSEAMMITDDQERIVAINPAFTEVSGYALEDVKGRNPSILSSGRQTSEFYHDMWQTLNATGHWQGEIWNRRKNGEEFAEWLTINTIFDDAGRVHRRVSLFSDISVKKKADALIWTQANFDSLTKLPNRRLFNDRLEHGLKVADREGDFLALLFIDLDRFKEVNDTFGHPMGDELLIEAAQRITSCVRSSDTVARFGGDEFVAILTELTDVSGIDMVSQKIIDALSKPYQIGEDHSYVTASIGITIYPDDASLAEDLLRNADQAMFAAKQQGRNRYSYYTPNLHEEAQRRMSLINDMHRALAFGEFTVHYQPIIDLDSGRIVKAEALLRWLHSQHGYISPDIFISIAEETGIIHEIGNMVFKESVQCLTQWREKYDSEFQISINKSPLQFMKESYEHEDWVKYLDKLGLAGNALVIEITEGVVMELTSNINEKLTHLRKDGVQVAIDDFGTGYSSLAYLKKFDIDYLKLDQSFVRNLESDTSDLVLSEAIVLMAHKLGFKVIAEGVETLAQHRILTQIGCDYAQGFLFSKAVPAEEFEQLLENKEQIPMVVSTN